MAPTQTRQQLTLPSGRTLGYQEWGRADGPVLVALHGTGQSSQAWRLAGPLLGERYRVIALDARGHGDSDWADDYSIEAMATDVRQALEVVGALAAIVVGHSMGGVTAFWLAATHPERVRALVLVDAPNLNRADPPAPLRTGPEPGDTFDWRAQVALGTYWNDPPQDWWDRAAQISASTLVVGGAHSEVSQLDLERLARLIPRGRYASINTGHGMQQERPGEFAALVMPFLADVVR